MLDILQFIFLWSLPPFHSGGLNDWKINESILRSNKIFTHDVKLCSQFHSLSAVQHLT